MNRLHPRAKENFGACIGMLALCNIALIFRFWAAKLVKRKPAIAEWLCVTSVLLFAAYTATILQCESN